MQVDRTARKKGRRRFGCIHVIGLAVMLPVAIQAFYSVQNFRATSAARRACNSGDAFEIRDAALVQQLIVARQLPENKGRLLISMKTPAWTTDPYNGSLEKTSYNAKVDGKVAFIVHDVAVHPRTIIDFLAPVRIISFQCMFSLNSRLNDLILAR